MLRLTDTRGSRLCPAFFQASRYTSICLRCCTCSGSPLSSVFSVELWRCIPSLAAHSDVAFELEPHQIRSRSPSECGSTRRRPGGFGNIGRGFGFANPSPFSISRNTSA